MSERLSKKGGEDMLASIRRLVADEVGPEPLARPTPAAPARLLLTAALRVEPQPALTEKVRPLHAVLDERRARQASRSTMAPLYLSEDLAVAPPSRPVEPLRLVPRAAPAEALVPAAPEPERNLPQAEIPQTEMPQTEAPLIDAPLADIPRAEAPPAASAPAHSPGQVAAPVGVQPGAEFKARLAQLEALLDAQPGLSYDDEAMQEDETGLWLMHHAQAAPAAPFIDIGLAPEDAPQRPEAEARSGLSSLDEVALRELVRSVLRDELDGPMGERVTRNLRKLIRTELARALAARGLG